MVLSQIRQTLDHAEIAHDGCRLYRVQADNGECKMRVHPLTADGHWSPLTEGQQWVLASWKSATTCYRAPNRHGECVWLARQMRCNVKAILETTFDQGVLALYCKEAIACSDADVGLFKGLGEVAQRAVLPARRPVAIAGQRSAATPSAEIAGDRAIDDRVRGRDQQTLRGDHRRGQPATRRRLSARRRRRRTSRVRGRPPGAQH